jgi:multiple sugar transport system permease protein
MLLTGRKNRKAPNNSKLTSLLLRYALLIALLVIALFPIYWMFVSSFRPNSALTKLPPKFLPFDAEATLENYGRILSTDKYLIYYFNSVVVALATVLVCLVVAVLAGYALSRYNFRGKSLLMTAILSVQMFPLVAILISLFTFYLDLKLTNTYQGLILADTSIALPFSIWFMKSFFDTIPSSLDEAATIDGCGRFRTIFQIIVPLSKPGLLAVGIYTFLLAWDDFIFALTLNNKEELRTLPVGIANSFAGEFLFDWSGMMTISVVASGPVLLLFIFLQRYMIAGLTQGSVKG